MILKVLIIFDPKLNLFKSDAYIFMQQSPSESEMGQIYIPFLNFYNHFAKVFSFQHTIESIDRVI